MDSCFLPNKCCYPQIDGSCYKITSHQLYKKFFMPQNHVIHAVCDMNSEKPRELR